MRIAPPRLAENTGMTLDEAVSLMGAVLPQLERWRTVRENEERYGEEARELYGNETIDAANERILDMDLAAWNDMKELERADFWASSRLLWQRATHAAPRRRSWQKCIAGGWASTGEVNPKTRLTWGLLRDTLVDPRFVSYYDDPCGTGATAFLVEAVEGGM